MELSKPSKYNIENFDSDEINWVNPKKIRYKLINSFDKLQNSSLILKGNWDKSKKAILKSEVYVAFKQRYKEGKNWYETKFYEKALSEIISGIIKFGCNSKEKWDQFLESIDNLYHQNLKNRVKNNLNHSFEQIFKNYNISANLNKIIVNIGRDGDMILVKGEFLLLLAKFLNIPKIPIKIYIRHKKWMDFKKELYYFSRAGKLYQQLNHPDLLNYTFKYGDKRFDMIKENLSIFKGKLLDIGANLGYFCHKLEDEGFDCYAVERNPLYVYFLKKLKTAESRLFKVIPGSIFRYKKNQDLNFDVVLALNIFHNFIVRKKSFLNLIKLLNRLKIKELFFGAHHPSEFKNAKVYQNFTPSQFVNFIIQNSCLTEAKIIGKTLDGRILYKLTSRNSL